MNKVGTHETGEKRNKSVLKRKKGALSVGWQTIQKGWSKREKLINALSIYGVQLTL